MFFLDNFLKGLKPRYDDDSVDRLNYYYTTMVLLVLALTLSAKQYVGQPIQCWVPAQYTGAWEQYTENYCFVQNTYFWPLRKELTRDFGERRRREIGYYQWVPFVLAIQGMLFYFPELLWRLFNWQSGINVKSLIRMAIDTENVEAENREKNVKIVAGHITDCLELQKSLKNRGRFLGCMFYGSQSGLYVTVLYMIIKLLYLGNVVGQFFILNRFLGFKDGSFWGIDIVRNLIAGREWEESGHFPRVTMCDFEIRVLGNLHRWTLQCVLMINMFNEKIFIFLWWWFFMVAVVTGFNIIGWMIDILGFRERDFVMKYLRVKEDVKKNEMGAVKRFIKNTLREDGILILRLVSINAGDLLATDLVHELWNIYKASIPPPPPPPLMNSNHPEKPPKLYDTLDDVDMPDGKPKDDGFKEGLYDPMLRLRHPESETAPLVSDQGSPSGSIEAEV